MRTIIDALITIIEDEYTFISEENLQKFNKIKESYKYLTDDFWNSCDNYNYD